MKFYNRINELAELQRIQKLSFNEHSRMTVVTGRRRIGKTSLVMRAVEGTPTVYLFVGRKNEATLCSEFIPVISQSRGICAWGGSYSFWRDLYSQSYFSKYMWAGVNGNHDNMDRKSARLSNAVAMVVVFTSIYLANLSCNALNKFC